VLTRLLQTLASGSITSYTTLAHQLDVSEDMLAHMLQDLARRGCIVSAMDASSDRDCASRCSGSKGCPFCASGSVSVPPSWALTDKGRRLAQLRR